jgi:LysR family transcriptional activator of nhaA
MVSDHQSLLMDRLRSGEIDAVISNYFAYGADLKVISELSMPVIAVAAPGLLKKLLWKKDESLLTVLKGQDATLVIPSDHLKIRIETDLFLQKLRLRNTIAFESDILAGVVRAAVEGAGIAFLPQPYITRELRNGSLMQIGHETSLWRHSISTIVRKSKSLDPVVTEIVSYFASLGAKVV